MKLPAWKVGGKRGCKIIFHTDTGDVFTTYARKLDSEATAVCIGRSRR